MSPKLQLLARRMNLSAPAEKEQAPDTGIGAAIESMIQQAVEERVEKAQSTHVKRLLDQQFNKPAPVTDYRQLPTPPRAIAPKALEFQLQRDELGRINVVNAGNMQWRVQRNELGEIVRLIPSDIAPMPPAIEPAEINQMRPRKLYGNDEGE